MRVRDMGSTLKTRSLSVIEYWFQIILYLLPRLVETFTDYIVGHVRQADNEISRQGCPSCENVPEG